MAGVMIGTWLTPITNANMVMQLFNGIDSPALMAVPFFLLVGELMTSANVVIRIANLSQALVGHVRGGWPRSSPCSACSFPACRARPRRRRGAEPHHGDPDGARGLQPGFVAGLIAGASTIAALVPPSIMAVVYGASGNVSIAGFSWAACCPASWSAAA